MKITHDTKQDGSLMTYASYTDSMLGHKMLAGCGGHLTKDQMKSWINWCRENTRPEKS